MHGNIIMFIINYPVYFGLNSFYTAFRYTPVRLVLQNALYTNFGKSNHLIGTISIKLVIFFVCDILNIIGIILHNA